jgi:hypothetical protein
MTIEVMKQALEALEECALALDWVGFGDCRYLEVMRETGEYTVETTPAITALRQAIAEAEQAQPLMNEQIMDLCAAEREAWRNAAIRVGENLATCGPAGYYDLTSQQWLDWAVSATSKMQDDYMQLGACGEREACAKLLDDMAERDKLSNYYAVAARAIRARGQDPMPLFADWNKDWK